MKYRNRLRQLNKAAIFLFFGLLLMNCSEAVLNADECSEARNTAKRFYSFHFGNEMAPSAKGLEIRTKFLTKSLVETLSSETSASADYFTRSEEFPKAFRVGKCEMTDKKRASLEVLLFWKRGEIKEQRPILVDLTYDGSSWLIDKVSNK